MPDGGGFSGLDLSEIGVSAKQAAGAVKKVTNPFVQAAKSQVSGKPAGQGPAQSAPLKSGGLGFGDIVSDLKSQTTGAAKQPPLGAKPPVSGTFDIAGFEKNKQQQTGGGAATQSGQAPMGGVFNMPTTTKPPSEKPQAKPAGGAFGSQNLFDFNEKNPFAAKKPAPYGTPQQTQKDLISQEEIEKQKAEDQKNIEMLKRKLHEEQTKEVMETGEEKPKYEEEEKKKKEEEEHEEKERKEQEKEERMAPVNAPAKQRKGFAGFKPVKTAMNLVTKMIKSRQGAKESKIGKG